MATQDAPWNAWEIPFPGSVEKGEAASYTIMFGSILVFGIQAVHAQMAFRKSKTPISKFYSTLITLNIVAMILVTGSASLSGLLQGYFRGYDPLEYPDTAKIVWGLTATVFACIHSVNNCCRVVHDAYGLRYAIYFIPVAVMMQFWQVLALPFGLSPYLGVIVLTGIDYCQHLFALSYWSIKCIRKTADEVDKKRISFGIWGVILHMTSIVPQMLYTVTTPTEEQTPPMLCAVYVATILMMSGSQYFWIQMALRTPPDDDADDNSKIDDAVGAITLTSDGSSDNAAFDSV